MVRSKVWFGKPGAFNWVPAPASGMSVNNSAYSEVLQFEDGTADVVRTAQYHKEISIDFPVQESNELNIWHSYATGLYGAPPFYWSDPMLFEQNLVPPAWSAPSLIEQGWHTIFDGPPTFIDTAANSYNQPPRTVLFDIAIPANSVPSKTLILAIPPGYVLNLGYSGAVTGTGVFRYRTYAPDGTMSAASTLTPLSATGSTRMNTTISGDSFSAVELFITRTTNVESTIEITSIMAQLYRSTLSPVLPTNFILGQGTVSLKFSDQAIPETYVSAGRRLKGLSTSLLEVS